MNISAVGCTPIKPQVSFRNVETEHQKLHDMANELGEQSVGSKDIKKPLAIVASLAALAGIAYGGGKKAASGVAAIYEKVAPVAKDKVDDVADDVAVAARNAKLGIAVEKGLRKASSVASKGINVLRTTADDATTLTKSQKTRNFIADKLDDGLALAKKAYKKVAYHGIPENVSSEVRAKEAFENLAGAVGLATVVPEIASRDANKDGVNDILQKSQNAYTAQEEKSATIAKEIGTAAEILELFT